MVSIASADLIAELEGAIKGGSPQRRAQILQQVAQLVLARADRLDERQIGFFGDVLIQLIECAEPNMLARLSTALSELKSAPRQVIRALACHEAAIVAAPLLLKSEALSETDLIEIAGDGGQQLEQEVFEALPLSVAQRTIRFRSARDFVKPGLTDNAFPAARATG